MDTVRRLSLILRVSLIMTIFISGFPSSAFASSHTPIIKAQISTTVTINDKSQDGELVKLGCSDWESCHTASSATAHWTNLKWGTVASSFYTSTYDIKRIFYFFDTSIIPTNATVLSAVLHFYSGQFQNGDTTIHVVKSTANSTLSIADFSRVQFQSGGTAAPPPNEWVTIPLNSPALNWIIKGGLTKLALIHAADLNDTTPIIDNRVEVAMAENSRNRPYLVVTYSRPDPIVNQALLDLGMPYNTNRGCASPYTGCNGPFHGFYHGVGTDLVLDSYTAGAPFNIQDALRRDYLATPERYRYGTARNAEDMRRYFAANQRLLNNTQAYRTGDIAFFDWNGDGLADHASIISVVDSNNRPLDMVDATGIYSGNPTGLVIEHAWASYYDAHVQGHGRLLSESPSLPPLQILRVTLDTPAVNLRLFDSNGKSTSATYDENLVASNVEAFIPYIPGGSYSVSDTQKVITVTQPLADTSQFFIELQGAAASNYDLRVETLQGVVVTDSQDFSENIGALEAQVITVTLSESGGDIHFSATSPISTSRIQIPTSLELSGFVGSTPRVTFNVVEVTGGQSVNEGVAQITNLDDQMGGVFASDRLSITPGNFTIAPGGEQSITIQANLIGATPGLYQGKIFITSQNAPPTMIPFTLYVQSNNIYLPINSKNGSN